VDDNIAELEPEVAPLVTLLMKLKKRSATTSPRCEWIEDDYRARWGQMGGTGVGNSPSDNALTVVDGTIFVAGDVFVVPKVTTSSAAPEYVRVVSVAGNVLTVTRAFGGSTIDTIPANSALRLVGSAFEEGGTLPSAKTTNPVTKITYTQVFKTTIDFSNTQIATTLYGSVAGGERRREHAKKLKEHKEKLNATLLWGRASENLTGGDTGKPIRTTMGLNSVVTENIMDGGGVLTARLLDNWARSCFRYNNNKPKILLASPILISAIHHWATSHLMVRPMDKRYGVAITEVQTGHGTWLMVRDWMLEAPPAGSNGFQGTSFSVDLDQIEYIYLSNNKENRDTKLYENVVGDGADRKIDLILTEGGYKIKQPKYHGKLFNVESYQ
jgi:hypothetical protein